MNPSTEIHDAATAAPADRLDSARPLFAFARVAGIAVGAAGIAVLVGWVLRGTLFRNVLPTWVTTNTNTALTFAFAGAALESFARSVRDGNLRARAVATVCAWVALTVTSATLIAHGLGGEFNFDEFLFQDDPDGVGALAPARMAPQIAFSFLLLGVSLLSLRWRRVSRWLDAVLVLPVVSVALLSIASYMYAVPAYEDFLGRDRLALHTAMSFLGLALGILAARGKQGLLGIVVSRTAGGPLVRRLLPAVIVLPLASGWLFARGFSAGHYGAEFGLAGMAVLDIMILAIIVWFSAVSTGLADAARHRAAAALTYSEERYRQLFNDVPVPLYRTSPEGEVLDGNRALIDLLGIPEGNVTGGRVLDWYADPLEREAFSRRAERDGVVAGQTTQLRRTDGTPIWVVDVARRVQDPTSGQVTYEGGLIDITERRRAEQAVRESDERFREMADHIKEAFFVVDLVAGKTLYVSPTWAEIWARPIEDGYDPNVWFDAIHPDDRAAMGASQAAVKRGESSTDVFRVIRPDKAVRWVRGRVFPVHNQAGEIYRMVGVTEDITELRQAEERFTQAQKMEAVGRLAGGVAHDFNNLLTVILADTEIVQSALPAGSEEREFLAEVRRAGESAVGLTRQLLAFSRKQLVEPVVFELNDAVADTGKMLRRLIGEDVRLEVKLAANSGSVRADRGQVEQVLTNLAVNARDAMPQGGTLIIETASITLDAAYASANPEVPPGDYVMLVLSDTGTGMSEDVRKHAFEPFFTTKERGKGTGLGLATCHGIIKQAGGHISIYSEIGIGTTFRVFLPRVVEEAARKPAEVARHHPRGDEAVLLVEDEPGVRRVGVRLLRGLGYQVFEACDAVEATRILSSLDGALDLLFTDVVLPGVGGRELAESVRKARPGIKVLYTTGYTDDVILQHQLIARDVAVLQKPYTLDSIARKVRDVLDG